MATILLICIYILTIGLGIPDSAIGSAWPSLRLDLNLPISYANFVTTLISLFTVVASYFSAKINKLLGVGLVTFISTVLTCGALIGFSLSNSIIALCIFAIPAGLGAGSIDAAINSYVSLHYSSFAMNVNHCFYGIGVAVTPYLMSLALSANGSWRFGYRLAFYIQIFIVAIGLIALPLWKRVKHKNILSTNQTEKDETIIVPYRVMAKTPKISMGWLVFFATCALEFTCGTWACSYIVSGGVTNEVAAKYLTLYYIGMTAGRFVAGLITTKLSNKTTIFIGYGFVLSAIVLLLLPLPLWTKGVSLFFIGFGNGPTFPNMVYLAPRIYGKARSQSIIGSFMVMCNLGILFVPPLFGLLAQSMGLKIFPVVLCAIYVIMVLSTIIYFRLNKAVSNRGQGVL